MSISVKNRPLSSLGLKYPEIASQWHPHKNGKLTPFDFTYSSNKKVWWVCPTCNGEWNACISNRTSARMTGCRFCSGQGVKEGYNDLQKLDPRLSKEWHLTKNGNLYPKMVTANTPKVVWWICSQNHEWKASIRDRHNGGGCRICFHNKLPNGSTSLEDGYPEISKEWDFERNSRVPKETATLSNKKAFWICSTDPNHKWLATISNRTRNSSGCPICFNNGRSRSEDEVANYIKLLIGSNEVFRSDRSILNGLEIDIVIPNKKVGVEFNGLFWHSEAVGRDKLSHYKKWLAAKNAGYSLLQFWEDDWILKRDLIEYRIAYELNATKQLDKIRHKNKNKLSKSANMPPLTSRHIDKFAALEFLESFSLQGFCEGNNYLSLMNGESIVAVMVLISNLHNNQILINQYGAKEMNKNYFGQLLKFATSEFDPESYVVFADRMVSDSEIYKSNGFTEDGDSEPDYCYSKSKRRHSKLNFKLQDFKNNDKLHYEKGLNEKQLAELNGMYRLWDAGKVRYTLNLRNRENIK